uniref:Uncharacterized protein n=1 Tax=Anoplophora glabripennis TaxID=217634 RepID=V5FR81_ANOGL
MVGLNSVTVLILEANKFNNWHFRIVAILKREMCNEALEGPPGDNATTEVRSRFIKVDAKAQSIIVHSVSDKHLHIIKDCEYAKDQIAALKGVFVRSSSFTKLTLWR